MKYVLHSGGPLDRTADVLVAGDGLFTLKRLFGRCFPTLLLACELRGLPPLLVSNGDEPLAAAGAQSLAPTYHLLRQQAPLPAFDRGRIFQYVIARNGVFLLAKSRDVEVCLPLADGDLPGLTTCTPFVRFLHPCVPALLVEELFASARAACLTGRGDQERLFYLLETDSVWQLVVPEQEASEWSVKARFSTPEFFAAVLEGHSHHRAAAFFSDGDDEAELLHGGFRIFFVVGLIREDAPELLVRICVHGYDWIVPAELFFELPASIRDAYWAQSGEGARR